MDGCNELRNKKTYKNNHLEQISKDFNFQEFFIDLEIRINKLSDDFFFVEF